MAGPKAVQVAACQLARRGWGRLAGSHCSGSCRRRGGLKRARKLPDRSVHTAPCSLHSASHSQTMRAGSPGEPSGQRRALQAVRPLTRMAASSGSSTPLKCAQAHQAESYLQAGRRQYMTGGRGAQQGRVCSRWLERAGRRAVLMAQQHQCRGTPAHLVAVGLLHLRAAGVAGCARRRAGAGCSGAACWVAAGGWVQLAVCGQTSVGVEPKQSPAVPQRPS